MLRFFKAYQASSLKLSRQVNALYVAARHPQTPWYAKLLIGAVVGYALSPIDLIPDFIPVLGALDDLLLVPLGIYWCLKLIPDGVMEESYHRADLVVLKKSFRGAAVIVFIWLLVITWFIFKIIRYMMI